MPIIIYGYRRITSVESQGEFTCPQCETLKPYTLYVNRPWATLFWIPIFPIGSAIRFVECNHCDSKFDSEILNYQSSRGQARIDTRPRASSEPSDLDPLIYTAHESLLRGVSTGIVQFRLQERGYSPQEAEATVRKLCDGEPRPCTCGRRYHSTVTMCDDCDAVLPT
jgi:hypothetical protein